MKLKNVMSQIDLPDSYRTFHPNREEYTFFSESHGTFYKTDHIIGHKARLNRYKKIEIISCILSDHHRLKSVFRNNEKSTNSWKFDRTHLGKALASKCVSWI
jgi:exonuclease III